MDYHTEISKLEDLYAKKRYYEVISLGVQFIDFFSDRVNRPVLLHDITKDELDEIESQTGIPAEEWKNLKSELQISLNRNESWKYKFIGILDEILDSIIHPNFNVTAGLIAKVRYVHSIRNKIHHDYYTSEISEDDIRNASFDCLEICKLFEKFEDEFFNI